MFRKDWFAISKLIFHFLEYYNIEDNWEYYNIKNDWIDINRIKSNIETISNCTRQELYNRNIREAAKILGFKEVNGDYNISCNSKFNRKLFSRDMRFLLSGGPTR